jgi:hypothetical protein
MKFRTIFILFNAVILISFLFVLLLPLFLLGPAYTLGFWKENWSLALLFLLVLGGVNAFFGLNWKVFTLLEAEDWSGLSAHLVDRVFVRKRYGSREVTLLVNAYLLLGDVSGIEGLEVELKARRPALLRRHALLFGVTRLLRNKPAEAEAFLAPWLDAMDVEDARWLRFDWAFSLVLQRRIREALPRLKAAALDRDAVLSLLAAYLIGNLGLAATTEEGERAELAALAEARRAALRKRFPPSRWNAEVERAKGEIHIVVLSRLIDDAGSWLFATPASSAAAAPPAQA